MVKRRKTAGAETSGSIHKVSVIVPKNPFAPKPLQQRKHCMCALDVEKLMAWWPGTPHVPHRDAKKVKNIQRSLDWKRVCQIASYLLQEEIIGAPEKLDKVFASIYEPKRYEPGREWPPKVSKIVGFQRSGFPTFSNVLIHVNGARIEKLQNVDDAATLVFDEESASLNFSVIDGQHRINGAYFAVQLLKSRGKDEIWEIPAEIFIDLDAAGSPPTNQAQIFIDVNFNQKKVDRSLVADLYPTARGAHLPLDDKERAQDVGRRLMLETGPLVGLIQIPGIRYGAKDVVTLATLSSAIEDTIEVLKDADVTSLEGQSEFLAKCLEAWLEASGRLEDPSAVRKSGLSSDNAAYQGRVIVSVLTLLPAIVLDLRTKSLSFASTQAYDHLHSWFQGLIKRANLLKNGKFLDKATFKQRQYLGAGGVGRFRDVLWAAVGTRPLKGLGEDEIAVLAERNRAKVAQGLAQL